VTSAGLQEVVCCLGDVVAGNPLQYVVEKALAHLALDDWRCLTFQVSNEQLPDAVRGAKAFGFRGIYPAGNHQTGIVTLLDELTQVAQRSARVDFVIRNEKGFIGDCLLGSSVLTTVGEASSFAGKRAVILGSGGMARCLAVALANAKVAAITIVARHPGRGQALADFVSSELQVKSQLEIWVGDFDLDKDVDFLFNATTIGTSDPEAKVPVALGRLSPLAVVVDTTTNSLQTRLIREAAQHGCRTVDGLAILLEQTVAVLQKWTKAEAPRDIMREALEEFLGV
jgi:shikimate dehydrogenase